MQPASWKLRRKITATGEETTIRKRGHLKRTHHLQQIVPSVKKPLTKEFFSFTKQFSMIRKQQMIVVPTKQVMIVSHVRLWKVDIAMKSVA